MFVVVGEDVWFLFGMVGCMLGVECVCMCVGYGVGW